MQQVALIDPSYVTDILKYIVGPAVLTIITFLLPRLYRAFRKRNTLRTKERGANNYRDSARDISKLYQIMQGLKADVSGINRVIIIKSHNCGGDFCPATPTYLTALHEEPAVDIEPLLLDLQAKPVDTFYFNKILTPLISTGRYTSNSELAQGYWKGVYEAYHQWSMGAVLSIDKVSMIYVVFSFKKGESEDLTPSDSVKIEGAINRLSNIMKKY